MGSRTPNRNLYLPDFRERNWDDEVNENFELIDALLATSRFQGFFNVKDYGATGNGTTDDTVAIQAAFDAAITAGKGMVFFPVGDYRHGPLTLYPGSSSTVISVNLQGAGGAYGATLHYIGSSNGTGLTIANNVRWRMNDLRFLNATGSVGTTTGVKLTSLPTGSLNGPSTHTNIQILYFNTGLQLGTYDDHATSEATFTMLDVESCTVGVDIQNHNLEGNTNTGNLVFNMLASVNNTVGMRAIGGYFGSNGPLVTINGGGSALNTTDFFFLNPHFLTIRNYQSEQSISGGTKWLQVGADTPASVSGAYASVVLDHCNAMYAEYKDDIALKFHLPGKYTITNCQFGNNVSPRKAQIQVATGGTYKSLLTILNSTFQTISTPPVVAHATNAGLWKVSLRGVQLDTGRNVPSDTFTDDRDYTIDSDNNEFTYWRYPWSLDYGVLNGQKFSAQFPVIATADLPAASSTRDGNIVIEDAGTGNRNVIVYAGGQRFRLDGGANV